MSCRFCCDNSLKNNISQSISKLRYLDYGLYGPNCLVLVDIERLTRSLKGDEDSHG